MANLNLSDKEIELMQKSITHCIESCHKGGAKDGCTDCIALEGLLKKLSK